MPNNASAKTKSAPKRAIIAVALVLVGIVIVGLLSAVQSGTQVGSKRYTLETVHTPEGRQRGLSGRKTLPKDAGLLFVFEQSGRQCFWMKGMHFPIDIIWLSADKRILKLEKNVSPTTYPRTFCVDNAQYVIELYAGEINNAKIANGGVINL